MPAAVADTWNSRVHVHIHGAANAHAPPVFACLKSVGSGTLGVGVFRQEIHFVLGGDADDFADIRQIVKLIE